MRSNVLGKDTLAVEKNFPLEPGMAHGFVHAVEGAKQGGLATAGRTNKRGDLAGGDAHTDIEQGLLVAVKEIDLGDGHAHREGRRRLPRRCAGH